MTGLPSYTLVRHDRRRYKQILFAAGEEPSSEAQRHRATADGRDQVIIVTRERRDAPYAMRWGGRGKVQLGINELGDADEERSVLDVRVDPGKREVQGEVPLA